MTTGQVVRVAAWGAAVALLLMPLVAMRLGAEGVHWTGSDFVIAGAMLGGTGLAIEVAVRKSGRIGYRIAAALALLGVLLVGWLNGAVGIIGSEDNPANLMYAGVLAVGLIGTALARFRAAGMAWTVFAMAAAHVLVGAIALAGDLGTDGRGWPRDVIVLTIFFAVLWTLSGLLFRSVARDVATA